jgi:transglutaminase-like putative cysteine protease
MQLKITHTTTYNYDAPVNYALQQVRLTPLSNSQQTVLNWELNIEGGARELSFLDQYKNHVELVQAAPGIEQLRLTASGEVETNDTAGVLGKVYGRAPLWLFTQQTDRTMPGKNVRSLAKILGNSDDLLTSLHTLSAEILSAVPYGQANTFSETTAEEALLAGGGVCQDHAQIFISAARQAGISARYVSGYLMMNDRVDQDASHAWAEAHIDGLGWVGFDVSNGISPDERYVRIATGLDSRDAAPISGMRMGSASESMIVSLQVQQ